MKSQRLLYKVVRITLGILLLLTAVITMYKHVYPAESDSRGLSTTALTVITWFWDTGYLMWIVKAIELVFAISLLTNQYIRLTTLLFCPVLVNIILFGLFADNFRGLPIAFLVLAATLFIIYYNRVYYAPLLLKN